MADPFNKKSKYTPFQTDFFKDETDAPKGVVSDIKSKRTFGVELEIFGGDLGSISSYAVENGHSYGHDGSIKNPHGNNEGCIEVQTKVLSGTKGVKSLTDLMLASKKHGFKINGTCGTHVHLGGEDFFDKTKFRLGGLIDIKNVNQTNIIFERKLLSSMIESYGSFDRVVSYIIGDISYQLGKPYTSEYRMATGKFSRFCVVPVTYFKELYYLVIRDSTLTKMGTSQKEIWEQQSITITDKAGKLNIFPKDVVVVYKEETDKFKKLKKLFYFYTIFNNVLFSMLPKERRSNNFCKKLSSTYSIKDIQKCNSQGELEKVWYQKETFGEVERDKNSSLQGNSSDSRNRDSSVRSHSINFHSLYYKHRTVEIRMHHGTLNPESLLLWIELHQRILDAVSNNEVSDQHISACARGYDDVYDGGILLIEALNLQGTNLEQFIKHRIKKYN